MEAKRDPKRGIEATVIVKNGTLSRGDAVHTRTASGKVKILENFLGKTVSELEPSAPAIIIGFEKIPKVGEEFAVGELAEERRSVRQHRLGECHERRAQSREPNCKVKTQHA